MGTKKIYWCMQKYISVEQKHIGVQNDNETVIYILLSVDKEYIFYRK